MLGFIGDSVLNPFLSYKKEIGLYFLTRIALIWVLITYFNSTAFLDDINILYYFGTHPLCLITGSFTEAASTVFGAYSPLQPLIYTPFIAICNSLNGVRLATFTFEFLTLLMMILIGDKIIKKETLHKMVLIYILIPLSWVENIVWAQDEILAALFLLVVLYFKLKDKEDLAALSLGLTCVCSKIIPLIIFVPLLLTANNKKRTFLLAILPIVAIYLPVNYNYRLLGIGSPFLAQIYSNIGGGALTIPYLFKLLTDSSIQWGVLAFILLSASFLAYYAYLFYRYQRKDMPNFIDMLIVSFLIYFVLFFGAIHPEHYIFIFPILLLRLAMLDKINIKETLLMVILSISSITWKVLHLIGYIYQNPAYVSGYAAPNRFFELHSNLIGNQFFKLEEIIFLVITLVIIIRYLIFFVRRHISLNYENMRLHLQTEPR